MATYRVARLSDDVIASTPGLTLTYDEDENAWRPAPGGGGIQNVSGTVDLPNAPGIVEVYATAAATVEGVSLAAGDAAVFRFLAGAWTYMIVGEHTNWQAVSATPVTANVPTMNDSTNQITWTPKTGVEYVIGGQVRTPPYSVGDVTASVTVTAQATTGYTLTGTTSWTFNFTGSAPADTTPPTAGTLASSALTATSFTLTVSGASDDQALHATPYAFSTDGGTSWSAWQAGATYDVTGRAPSTTYQCKHKVRDATGNEAQGATVAVTTPADPTVPTYGETFSRPDATVIQGLSTEMGARPLHTTSSMWLTATVRASTNAALAIQGGKVTVAGGTPNGIAIEATNASTYRDSRNQVAYDVSAATNAAVFVSTASPDGAQGEPVIIYGDGRIARYSNPTGSIATGQPTTGVLEVERAGLAVNIKINGTQVATWTAASNATTLRFGVAAQFGASFDDWKVWA